MEKKLKGRLRRTSRSKFNADSIRIRKKTIEIYPWIQNLKTVGAHPIWMLTFLSKKYKKGKFLVLQKDFWGIKNYII